MGEKNDFGWAVAQMKEGRKVSRRGWNGAGMFACYMPGMTVPGGMVNERTKAFVPPGDLRVDGYFALWTAQETWQPGWHPSQRDCLADDWFAVED